MTYHNVQPPSFLVLGVEYLTQFAKKGGLTGPQFLDGGSWKSEGANFFRAGCSFYVKNKLKLEIFSDKKSL